jgi:hypothetical protein
MIQVCKRIEHIVNPFFFSNYLEPLNDLLLWSPPLDTNQEENSTLVNKYLKLAAKECMSN